VISPDMIIMACVLAAIICDLAAWEPVVPATARQLRRDRKTRRLTIQR
jgi:hypothetical protein